MRRQPFYYFALASALAVPVACIDEPHPVPGPGQRTPAARLSEMRMFAEPLADLRPIDGAVAYDVAVTAYADGADRARFVWVPPGEQLGATTDRWDVPVGTYFIKSFGFPRDARDPSAGRRLVETRFLVQTESGLEGSTYVWDADQRDAIAVGGNEDVAVDWIDAEGNARAERYHVPGLSTCDSCHDDRALGIRTRQQPNPSALVAAGVLDGPPPGGIELVDPSGTAPLDARARSYLDANCGHCHAQGGDAASTGVFWNYEQTDVAHLPLCRSTRSVGGNSRVIVPGHPEKSAMISRLFEGDAFLRMPRGPTRIPDPVGTALLSDWIRQMPEGCP